MGQIVQIVGALFILAPFALAQFGRIDQHAVRYLLPNALGSGILCAIAVAGQQWGFVLLEGTWSLVSLFGLGGVLRGTRGSPSGHA